MTKNSIRGETRFLTALILAIVVVVAIVGAFAAYHKGAPTTTTSPTPTTTSSKTTTTVAPTTTTTATTRTSVASTTTTTTTIFKPAVIVKDFRGKTITLKEPAKRIVVLESYWAEVLQALGAGDRIVGVGKYVKYDKYLSEDIRSKPPLGSVFSGVNIEQLVALKPDVVIMDCAYSKADDIIRQIESMGIPVVGLFMKSFDDEIRAIEVLGNVTGQTERAKELASFMKERYGLLKQIAQSIPEDKRLRVVMISGSSVLKGGALSVYANTSWGVALEDVGAVNIALREHPSEKWPKIDFETLARWDPDAIIITSSMSKIHRILDKIMNDPKWQALRAFKEGRIYVVPVWGSIGGVLDWGPRDIIGREYLACILYPEYYSGKVDWRSDMEHLLTRFYNTFIPAQAFASYSLKWKEVVDVTNTTIKLPRKIERVVDVISYKIVVAFNETGRLVGVSKYAKMDRLMRAAFPGVKNLTSPGSSWSMNVEQLSALNPDVVFIWPYKPDIVKEIENLGIPVVKVQLYSYNDILRLIWLFGAVYDKQDRAYEIVSDMNGIVKLVQDRVKSIPEDKRVKVLYLWSKPTKVQGGKGTVNDFIVLAGGVNVAAKDLPGKSYVSVDKEKIVAWNPDVIIIWWWARYNETTILSDPVLKSVNAVKNNRVYREPYYEHWGPDATLFILWLAKIMYPDRFSDINFTSIADQHYLKWYGVYYSAVAGS